MSTFALVIGKSLPQAAQRRFSPPPGFCDYIEDLFKSTFSIGAMLEWLKRHAWKACIRQKRIPSSNLGRSAQIKSRKQNCLRDFCYKQK